MENKLGANGLPAVNVPIELLQKYPEFFEACVRLNEKMLLGGSVEELEQIVTLAGKILGFGYASMKGGGFGCINDEPV